MFITVIIVAYDLKQFILEAIKSVLNQTLPKERYEVIVIKNYLDDNIYEFATKTRIKNIFSKKRACLVNYIQHYKSQICISRTESAV